MCLCTCAEHIEGFVSSLCQYEHQLFCQLWHLECSWCVQQLVPRTLGHRSGSNTPRPEASSKDSLLLTFWWRSYVEISPNDWNLGSDSIQNTYQVKRNNLTWINEAQSKECHGWVPSCWPAKVRTVKMFTKSEKQERPGKQQIVSYREKKDVRKH